MIKAEIISWPVTLAIMVLAFGSLVAAGLPLLLTLAGLVASAGGLVLLNEITPISVWAMNFAMMFALALGIDYALFLVVRFRDALRKTIDAGRIDSRRAVAETMDTAGKAVLLSGLTVLISLSAVLLVPAPAVRIDGGGHHARGGVRARCHTRLASRSSGQARTEGSSPGPSRTRSDRCIARRSLRPGVSCCTSIRGCPPSVRLLILVALSIPALGLKVAMPSISVVPEDAPVRQGYELVQAQMGEGAPGMLQIIAPTAEAEQTA